MLFKTDGKVFRCETAAEFVRQFHSLSFDPGDQAASDAEYMEGAAKRLSQKHRRPIRHASAKEFVEDMVAVGELEIEKED